MDSPDILKHAAMFGPTYTNPTKYNLPMQINTSNIRDEESPKILSLHPIAHRLWVCLFVFK